MEGRIDGSLNKFCHGKEGCVCIAVCEAPIWKETIGQTVCNGTIVNKDHVSQRANAHEEVKDENGHGVGHVGNLIAGEFGGPCSSCSPNCCSLVAAIASVPSAPPSSPLSSLEDEGL